MATINSLTDGTAAVGTDEFVINRAGTDFKLSHTQIVATITAALAAEVVNRQNADTNLTNSKLNLSGGTMSGLLTLSAGPSSGLHAATKTYVDTADALLVPLSGGTMTGFLTLSSNPTANAHASNKAYTDSGDAERWKNTLDFACNTNPNYPASLKGATYRVSAAGKIGGISGKTVQVDDIIYCHTADATGGTEASVGANYCVLQTNLLQSDDTTLGYIRISTSVERDAGSDNTVAMTPLAVREVVKDFVPGYDKTLTANTSITIATSTASQLYLCTGTGSGAVGVTLPQISLLSNVNITLIIKDAGANAAANNITITRAGSDTIDGATTKVISTNSGVVTLVNNGSTGWFTI